MEVEVLRLNDVSKVYSNKTKIGEVSFSLQAGDCVAMCGENGAGKSTLIKLITGQIKADTGTITIMGKEAKFNPVEYNKLFSYVPEDASFPPDLTAREILGVYASILNLPDVRAKEVCDLVGLLKYANKKVREYSKGMKQRLLIAQALLSYPPLVIFDEPSNGLDIYWSSRVKEIIKEMCNQKTAVLLTTHIINDVEQLADKLIVLKSGKIITFDTMQNLNDKYGYHNNLEEHLLKMICLDNDRNFT